MEKVIQQTIKGLSRKGAYSEVPRYIESLLPEVQREPEALLEKYRAFLRNGDAAQAEATLAKADTHRWTPANQLIYALELASIKVYRYMAIEEAMREGKEALDRYKVTGMGIADLAEAERIFARIQLSAATYRLIGQDEKLKVINRLAELAIILNKEGRTDESLAAAFTHAERQEDLPAKIRALTVFSDNAFDHGRVDLAAEAWLFKGEQMLKAGYPTKEILITLNKASDMYQQVQHVYGLIDVKRQKAMVNIYRQLGSPDELQSCLEAYEVIHYYRGMLSILMDLSQLAHDSGDTKLAAAYCEQSVQLTERTGMGLTRDSILLSQVDICIRHADYGRAIELCQDAVSSNRPAISKAGYEVQMASAYSFVDDYPAACSHGRKAIALYKSAGAEEYASDVIVKLASDLSAIRREEAWLEAEALLNEWIPRDNERENYSAVVSKMEMLAQIKLLRFNYSGVPQMYSLPEEASEIIQRALELVQLITGREGIRRKGNLLQLMGQVYQAKGDEERIIQAWKEGLAVYQQAGFTTEITNCHYMLGVIYLNRAYNDLLPNFPDAETYIKAAITGYDNAIMREKSADARYMLALLYTNASLKVVPDLANQMTDAAVQYLFEAEADYDTIRREFKAGDSVMRIQAGKQALVKKSLRIYQLALKILCVYRPDATLAWSWVQRAKARGLTDVLGISAVPPAQVISAIGRYPESYQLLVQETELTGRINKAPREEQTELRNQLDALWEKMRKDEHLTDYIEIRNGLAVDEADIVKMTIEDIKSGQLVVCVDWIALGDLLFMIVLRPGSDPQLAQLSIPLGRVRSFIDFYLSKAAFRSNLKDTPEVLRELVPLVEPLKDYCQPDEILILCPTGPLHGLPLHALEIEGNPLIERNPVVYTPSLSILRHCVSRHAPKEQRSVILFGDPQGDRPKATELVNYLAGLFDTNPILKEKVTRHFFSQAITGKDLVHFQGHAVHDPLTPLDSYLVMADGIFTANDVFNLTGLNAELVTLAACESAANVIVVGDEPIGLIPAFLYAGAQSVLATLWKVNQSSAAEVMRLFYEKRMEAGVLSKAQALRDAVLSIKAMPGFESPYHWGPFVLYGDWH